MKRRPRHKKRRGWRLNPPCDRDLRTAPQHVIRGTRVRGMKWRVFKRAWARKLSRFRANTKRILGCHDNWMPVSQYVAPPTYIADTFFIHVRGEFAAGDVRYADRHLQDTAAIVTAIDPLHTPTTYVKRLPMAPVDSSTAPGFVPTPKVRL